LKMAIEVVDFPIKNDDFPRFFVCLPEGSNWKTTNANIGGRHEPFYL